MKLKDLEIGSRVRDAEKDLIFFVAAQDHPGYGGTTLFSEKIVELGCLDAAEPEHPAQGRPPVFYQAHEYGWNDYAASNVHQWLNGEGEDWYQPSHPYDCPPQDPYLRYGEVPYTRRPGFLTGFSGLFREALLEVEVPFLRRTGLDQGELASVRAKVFLPSRTEMGKGDEHGIPEGKMMPLFYDHSIYRTTMTEPLLEKYGRAINPGRETAPYDAPQIYDPKYGWWYWVRTANMGYVFLNRVASPYGALSYTYSNNDSVGIRPMLCLDGELEVESNGRFMEIFTITGT